jgi:uncharacterized membrane protein YozB (DUF420 family)
MNMAFDVKTIAEINLAVQILLTLAMIGAVYMVKNKQFGRHCATTRIAVLVQILAIIAVMMPSMNGYLAHGAPSPFFRVEMLVHHFIGLAILVLWVYINLVFLRHLRSKFRIRTIMRIAMALWVLSLIIGIHVFLLVYV